MWCNIHIDPNGFPRDGMGGLDAARKITRGKERGLRVTFDVYLPHTEFSRRNPDPVNFRLCVCSDGPPDFAELVQLEMRCSTPVKYCYMSDGIVSIYGLGLVDI